MAEEDKDGTNKVAETIKAVEGVVKAVPVYEDAIQPAAKELGKALETTMGCVNLALKPLEGLVWGWEKIEEFVRTRLAEKLSGIPSENIVTPKPEIAVPALEALRYTGHEEVLREMFASLLATAMNTEKAQYAHPAFVEVIKNLSASDARVMRLFTVRGIYAIVDVQGVKKANTSIFQVRVPNHSHIANDADLPDPILAIAAIENLCRLGLLEIDSFAKRSPESDYDRLEYDRLESDRLESDPLLSDVKRDIESAGDLVNFRRKSLSRTPWGGMFRNACIVGEEGGEQGS